MYSTMVKILVKIYYSCNEISLWLWSSIGILLHSESFGERLQPLKWLYAVVTAIAEPGAQVRVAAMELHQKTNHMLILIVQNKVLEPVFYGIPVTTLDLAASKTAEIAEASVNYFSVLYEHEKPLIVKKLAKDLHIDLNGSSL